MNLLERFKKTISIEDAKQAANNHREAVELFLMDMKAERVLLNFNEGMKKKIGKRKE